MGRCFSDCMAPSMFALAACGGGHGSVGGVTPAAVAVPQAQARAPQPNFTTVPMNFTVVVPLGLARGRRQTPALLHQHFVATNTQSIELDMYKPNTTPNSANLLQSSVFGLFQGATGCVERSTARVCRETVQVPSSTNGMVRIVAHTYDAQPVSGTI